MPVDRMDPYDREEQAIQQDYADGLIDNKEMWRRQLDLQRDAREDCEEACREAADREREQW